MNKFHSQINTSCTWIQWIQRLCPQVNFYWCILFKSKYACSKLLVIFFMSCTNALKWHRMGYLLILITIIIISISIQLGQLSMSKHVHVITHVLLVTLVCKNKYRAPSRCIHDPTFRHSSLVSSSGTPARLECRNVGSWIHLEGALYLFLQTRVTSKTWVILYLVAENEQTLYVHVMSKNKIYNMLSL